MIVTTLPLGTLIPVIQAANQVNIKSKFKHQKHTKIDGEQAHTTMTLAARELARNAITSKTSFGCKKRGCLSLVIMKDVVIYKKESGFGWIVLAT